MRLRLPMHGRDHRPGGADPIPGLRGDYVFLQEIVEPEESGDSTLFDFENIDQQYRHLVLECSLNSYGRGDDDGPGELEVGWGPAAGVLGSDYASAQQLYWSLDDPTFSIATKGRANDTKVWIKNIMPGRDEFGFGDVTGVFATVTLKFLYYSRTDRQKCVLWNGVSFAPISGDGSYTVAHTVGGAAQGVPSDSGVFDPIEFITIDSQGFMGGSSASLYGIR